MTRLYLSGPVTGKPDGNYKKFLSAGRILSDAGYLVTIPQGIVDEDSSHDDAVIVCINELTSHAWSDGPLPSYDGVALLPGWEQSEGARLEKAVAEACGIPVKTVDEWIEEAR